MSIKIIGKPITAPPARSKIDFYFPNFIQGEPYHVIEDTRYLQWKTNARLMAQDSRTIYGLPKKAVKKSVSLGVKPYVTRTLPEYTPSAGEVQVNEPVVTFKYDHTRVKAIYYITSNTLVSINDFMFINKVITWLEDNGYLKKEESEKPKFVQALEIHNGEKKLVQIRSDRKIVSIGADPEFEVLANGKVCRPPNRFYGVGTEYKIGLDGAGSQIEVRPKASAVIDLVVQDLKKELAKIEDPLSTLGHLYSLGGHIHVGVGKSYTPHEDLLRLLNIFLGEPTLNLSGEARSNYKKLGTYETKPWGFEYRTPPAAIFTSPDFTYLSFKIVKGVVECYINQQEMEVNTPPIFEDYFNYCFFTKAEYDKWLSLISGYKSLDYKVNINSLWNDDKPATTNYAICAYAKLGQTKCTDSRCSMCRPAGMTPQPDLTNVTVDIPNVPIPPIHEGNIPNADDVERGVVHCGDPDCTVCNRRFGRIEPPAPSPEELARRQARRSAMEAAQREINRVNNELSSLNLNLADDWHIDARKTVLQAFSEADYTPTSLVLFFGLRASRGDVTYGFELDGYVLTEDTPESVLRANAELQGRCFGFPAAFRVGNVTEYAEGFRVVLKQMVAKVIEVLRAKDIS